MNKNLYTKELKRNRKNLITWSLIVMGFTLMVLAIFPSMADVGDDLTKMMDKMPEEITKAMGMDAQTWTSSIGFYSTYYGIYIILLVGIFTTSTGATIISKEEKDGTSEFLMTKPISRKTIFVSKMASLFTLTMIIYFVQTITAIFGFLLFAGRDIDWSAFVIMHVHGLGLIAFFTTTGVLLSMFFKPKKNFMGIVVGIIFGSYFLNAISKATEPVEWLGYLSPFHYLEFNVLDSDYSISWLSLFVLLTLGSILLKLSFNVYRKKDING